MCTSPAERGISRTSRLAFDRAAGRAAAEAGRPLTDDQVMADLLKIYYQELYDHEVRAAFERQMRKPGAKSTSHIWRRERMERFLRAEEPRLQPTLNNLGWSAPSAAANGYVSELAKVLSGWAAARFNVAIPPARHIDFDPAVAADLGGGTFYIGPQSGYLAHIRNAQVRRALQTLRNIASGPLGAAGFLLGGNEGSDAGALVDAVLSNVSTTLKARSDFRNIAPPPDQRPVATLVETSKSARGLDSRTGSGPVAPRTPIGPPPPPGWTPPTPPAEPTSAPTPKAADGGKDYKRMTNAELKKLAKQDKDAWDELVSRYSKKDPADPTDSKLKRLARGGDETARAVLDSRVPSNERDLARAQASKRTSHFLTAVARRQNTVTGAEQFKSGGETAEEKALAPIGLATHTEWRAVRWAEGRGWLKPGMTLSMSGQYDPCPNCQRIMQETATRTGVTIIYWWPSDKPTGETRVFAR